MFVSDHDSHDAFLRAIHAAPEEAGPRLVYADWLEESGVPTWVQRAELIRVQVELASKGSKARRRREELHHRERELLVNMPSAWVEPWQSDAVRWTLRRGIIDRFAATATGMVLDNRFWLMTFQNDGQILLEHSDPDVPCWYGSYRLYFTHADAHLLLDIWRDIPTWVPGAGYDYKVLSRVEFYYQGRFIRTDLQLLLSLQETTVKGKHTGEHRLLTFVTS